MGVVSGVQREVGQCQLGHKEINLYMPGIWNTLAEINIPIIMHQANQHCSVAEMQELAKLNIHILVYQPKLHCGLVDIDFII